MQVQFQCPGCQAVLAAEAAQAGQACDCPHCQTRMTIPEAPAEPTHSAPNYPAPDPAGEAAGAFDFAGPRGSLPGGGGEAFAPNFGGPPAGVDVGPQAPGEQAPEANPFAQPSGPKLYHIKCPNRECDSEPMEVPEEMFGQAALCPACREPLELRFSDTIENREERRQKQEQKAQKFANRWFNYAIVAAIFVVGSVLALIVISLTQ